MDDPPARLPTSSTPQKWLVRRIYPSTWGAMLLAAAILSLIEIPGRRAGATSYAHGWPAIYLHRDYANDPEFIASLKSTTGWSPGSYIPAVSPGGASKTAADLWIDTGWPWEVERILNPWSMANAMDVSPWAIVLDSVAAALMVLAAGWAFQWWRPRHRGSLFRIRLRTLLIGVALLAVVCAYVSGWQREWRNEQREIALLPPGSLQSGWSEFPYAWVPPPFLPEWLLKTVGVGEYFNRLTRLRLSDDKINDVSLARLEALRCLKSLELNCKNVTEAGLEPLARLPRLAKLVISGTALSDAGLKCLAAVKSLSDASLRCEGVTAAGIDHLRELPQLHALNVWSLDDKAIDRLNALTGLEQLTITSLPNTQVHLARLPRLRQLNIRSLTDRAPTKPDSLTSLQLELLPALEALTVEGGGAIRLNNLSSLSELTFWGTTLDETSMRQLRELPNLESLTVYNGASTVGVPFELRGMSKLSSLLVWSADITEVHLRDLPSLESVTLFNNGRLHEFQAYQAPKLRSIRMKGSLLVPAVDLRDLGLTSLTVTDVEQTIDGGTYVPDRPHARHLAGLAQLSQLEELNLPWTELNADGLDGIARLGHLTTLDLSGTWLTDADLVRLKLLKNLADLDLSSTDVTDAGLETLQDMPRLTALHLIDTTITDVAVQRLRQRRPDLDVSFSAGAKQLAIDDLKTQISEVIAGTRSAIDVANPQNMGDRDLSELVGAEKPEKLEKLSVRGTHLTDLGLVSFAHLRKLQTLDLTNAHVSDAGLARLGPLAELRALSLSRTRIRGPGLKYLDRLEQLQALDLSETEVTDDFLANLQYVSHLEKLSLAHTAITDAGLAHLKHLPRLRVLDLSQTKVTDAGLAQLQGLVQLESLKLDQCDIEGAGLEHFRSLPRLRVLDLYSNDRLGDAGVKHLARLEQLKSLVLSVSNLSAESVRALAGMKNLHDLWWQNSEPTADLIAVLKQANFAATLHLLVASARFADLKAALPQVDFDGDWIADNQFQVFEHGEPRKLDPSAPGSSPSSLSAF